MLSRFCFFNKGQVIWFSGGERGCFFPTEQLKSRKVIKAKESIFAIIKSIFFIIAISPFYECLMCVSSNKISMFQSSNRI